MKICSKCRRMLPATTEFYHVAKNTRDGLYPSCKECKRGVYNKICDWCNEKYNTANKEQKFCSVDCLHEWQRSDEWEPKHTESMRKLAKGTLLRREQDFKRKFEERFSGFEYHSGYTNSNNNFFCKCKSCGDVFRRSAQITRPSRTQELTCDNCVALRIAERERQEQNRRLVRERAELLGRAKRILETHIRAIKREPLLNKVCDRCGEKFRADAVNRVHCDACCAEIVEEREERQSLWRGKQTNCHECGKSFKMKAANSRFCSTRCGEKAYERTRETKRRMRLEENGSIDHSITLRRVLKKNYGICQLCGQVVDESDFYYDDDGNFIVGQRYPSIDHIIPVSKGGTHTWDNVQLAHHYCNTLKGNEMNQNAS